jgi:hypothetical protein
VDLNKVHGSSWIDAAVQAAQQKLREGQDQAVIGHGDWITDNLRWHGNRLLVAYDWDSLIADSEAVIAGLAAAIYLYPALATVTETREFLDAYGHRPRTALQPRRAAALLGRRRLDEGLRRQTGARRRTASYPPHPRRGP